MLKTKKKIPYLTPDYAYNSVHCWYYCSHYRPHSPWCQWSTLPCPPQSCWCWSAAGDAYVWCQAWLGQGGEGPTGATKYQRRSLSHHDLPLWPHWEHCWDTGTTLITASSSRHSLAGVFFPLTAAGPARPALSQSGLWSRTGAELSWADEPTVAQWWLGWSHLTLLHN